MHPRPPTARPPRAALRRSAKPGVNRAWAPMAGRSVRDGTTHRRSSLCEFRSCPPQSELDEGSLLVIAALRPERQHTTLWQRVRPTLLQRPAANEDGVRAQVLHLEHELAPRLLRRGDAAEELHPAVRPGDETQPRRIGLQELLKEAGLLGPAHLNHVVQREWYSPCLGAEHLEIRAHGGHALQHGCNRSTRSDTGGGVLQRRLHVLALMERRMRPLGLHLLATSEVEAELQEGGVRF
mmetsp:Transcript_148963/g.478675  ORF Transcript_148963/g.478675 Transcript_148963/m.478675 type:complete len:238 (-) Transcript_148963:1502-2215(-)